MAPSVTTAQNLPEVTAATHNALGEGIVFRKLNVGDILKVKGQVNGYNEGE